MKDRIRNILEELIKLGGPAGVESYGELLDESFRLEIGGLAEFNHQTFLKYEATGDGEMFRVEIMHVFAELDVMINPQNAAGQLLRMLSHNTGSFSSSTAFIGAISGERSGEFLATLNSFHHFLTSWRDVEIAKALSLHLFDLAMGLTTKDTQLTMLKIFGENDQ